MSLKPDVALLDLMMDDYEAADPLWKATEYWRELILPLYEALRDSDNVLNFRRLPLRTGVRSMLPSNSGRFARLLPKHGILEQLPIVGGAIRDWRRAATKMLSGLDRSFLNSMRLSFSLLEQEWLNESMIGDHLLGNPDDCVQIDEQTYSWRFIGYSMLYCQLSKCLDWNKVKSIVELGSGYGGQAELFLRRHSHLQMVLVDIPPLLYLAELCMHALFPGEVLSYREARELGTSADLRDSMKIKRIAVVPPWKFSLVQGPYDLFWNAKSLQEMNENAANYVNTLATKCRYAFLVVYPGGGAVDEVSLVRRLAIDAGFRETACRQGIPPEYLTAMLFENQEYPFPIAI